MTAVVDSSDRLTRPFVVGFIAGGAAWALASVWSLVPLIGAGLHAGLKAANVRASLATWVGAAATLAPLFLIDAITDALNASGPNAWDPTVRVLVVLGWLGLTAIAVAGGLIVSAILRRFAYLLGVRGPATPQQPPALAPHALQRGPAPSAERFIRKPSDLALWAACAIVPVAIYVLLLRSGRSDINLVFIATLIVVVAAAFVIGARPGTLALLGLGLLLAWPMPIDVLRAGLPRELGMRAASQDLRWIGLMTVGVIALLLAFGRGPSARDPAGVLVRTNVLVNVAALLCVVGGPLIGWVVLGTFARGDIYMRPLVFGLSVGLFGLLLFSGYAAFRRLTASPGRAAAMAIGYPFALLIATMGPTWVVAAPPAPVPIPVSMIPGGRMVAASGVWRDQPPALAFDGRHETAWVSGGAPPGWIEVRFAGPVRLAQIRLLVAQSPAGETVHQVIGIGATGAEQVLVELRGLTRDGDWLTPALPASMVEVHAVRILTLDGPSWVAWKEIDLALDRR